MFKEGFEHAWRSLVVVNMVWQARTACTWLDGQIEERNREVNGADDGEKIRADGLEDAIFNVQPVPPGGTGSYPDDMGRGRRDGVRSP